MAAEGLASGPSDLATAGGLASGLPRADLAKRPPLYSEWGEVWEKEERQGDVVPPEVGEDRL